MAPDWLLKRGEVVLGYLNGCSPDQPFLYYRFTPTAAFEEVRPLFKVELELLNDGQWDQWKDAYAAIEALKLRLESADGKVITQFLLHVDDAVAWFRFKRRWSM